MARAEIEEKIKTLKKSLYAKEKDRNNAEDSIEEISDAIVKLQSKIDEIEENLNGTMETVKKRLERISGSEKFRSAQYANTSKIVFGSQSASSIGTLSETIKTAKKEFEYYDDLKDKLDAEITKIENEISELKIKLNEIGE